MKKLFFLFLFFALCSCNKSPEPVENVKPPQRYYFLVTLYTYPEVETIQSNPYSFDHAYKQEARIETSNIAELTGYVSEEQSYKVIDQWEAPITKNIKLKNDLFNLSANAYGISTEGTAGQIVETKIHEFDTYKDASIAHRLATNRPRDFMQSEKYYPKQ